MKLKLKAKPQDWLIFAIFAVVLLLLVSIGVQNIHTLAIEGHFAGLNPFPALIHHLDAVIIFYFFAVAFLFVATKSWFFERESGVGIAFGKKESKGYADWCTDKEMKKTLKMLRVQDENYESAGFPIINDGHRMWVDDGESHNIVIGSTGTGKTQCIIHPLVKILGKAGESMVITDPKGEIYRESAGLLKERGYKIVVMNFREPQRGNTWNPLALPPSS